MMDGDTPILIDLERCKNLEEPIGREETTAEWMVKGMRYEDAMKDFNGMSALQGSVMMGPIWTTRIFGETRTRFPSQ